MTRLSYTQATSLEGEIGVKMEGYSFFVTLPALSNLSIKLIQRRQPFISMIKEHSHLIPLSSIEPDHYSLRELNRAPSK